MKIGDLVKHTPLNDEKIGKLFPKPNFEYGLIVDEVQTNTEHRFWIIAGNKKGWYREAELTLI